MTGALLPRDARHDLLVRATLSPDPEGRRAYERWRLGVDLDTLDRPSVRMLPLLARRIEGAEADALAEQVQKVVRFTWLRTQMMVHAVLPALRLLAERGVPAMLVKGAAVVHHAGMDLAARPMDDLDLCVPLAAVPAATHALVATGFRCEVAPLLAGRPEAITSTLGSVPFTNPRGVMVDLHWHLLHERRHPDADAEFWHDAVASDLRGVPCLVTSREDTLVHVMEHGSVWHMDPALQWTADASMLLRAGELDWDRVVWRAQRQRLAPVLGAGLAYLRDVGAATLPAEPLARLTAARRQPLERLLSRLAQSRGRLAVAARERERHLQEALPPGRPVTTREIWRGARQASSAIGGPAPAGIPAVALEELVSGVLRAYGDGCPHLVAGWHYPEAHGTWSRDRRARIVLPLAEVTDGALLLEADVLAFVTRTCPKLEVEVRLDGRRLVTWPFHGTGPTAERRTAWIPARTGRRLLDLRLVIRDPRDGVVARFNADPRPLGLAMRSLTLRRG